MAQVAQERVYRVSYKKASGWTCVYAGSSRAEAFAAHQAEVKLGRTLVCLSECPE